jgi:hypothetical protein
VFLVWTNGEPSYSAVRIFVDGALAGEASGATVIVYISGLEPASYEFGVEGVCGTTPTARVSARFDVVAATPHSMPIDSIACSFNPATRVLTAAISPATAAPSLFIDVYLRRAGVQGLHYVKTVLGTATTVQVENALETDRLFLQFFDISCYGSELIGCPGPSCLPVLDVRVCQDIHGASSRVFLLWLPDAVEYTRFDIFVDGEKVGWASGTRILYYVEPIAPGPHTFGVKGICNGEAIETVARDFTVLSETPHREPATNLRCWYNRDEGTITATWLPGAEASIFIDVYVRHPGDSELDWAGTIEGSRTRVRVTGAKDGDEIVLQFFNEDCHGSPLITCRDPGPGDFIRGDANDSGRVDLSDGIFTLNFLFLGDIDPLCPDAADSNDDGAVNIADPVHVFNWLFSGGPPPPPPGGKSCGPDPSGDSLLHCLTALCGEA